MTIVLASFAVALIGILRDNKVSPNRHGLFGLNRVGIVLILLSVLGVCGGIWKEFSTIRENRIARNREEVRDQILNGIRMQVADLAHRTSDPQIGQELTKVGERLSDVQFGPQTVTLASPCDGTGQHTASRWLAKTDPEQVPADKSKITSITPSQMFAWQGVGVDAHLTNQSPRITSEQRWVALTGRVARMKLETDGDIYIELVDATGNEPGIVGAEIPLLPIWCEFRKLALSWTTQNFPLSFGSSKVLTVTGTHVVTVIGKAFYDIDHAPKDRSNQRRKPFPPGYSVWEIHPVMGMTR